MNKIKEQKIFLNHIRDIYLCNPNLSISKDTIYGELSIFYVNNGIKKRIGGNSLLLNVQQQLSKKFGGYFDEKGYFWAYENRNELKDREFYNKLYNSIKLYISVDAENLYTVATKVFEFMKEEHIVTQSKVAKKMRNDVLVVRVSTKKEARKVIDFVNGLNYKAKVKPNPFSLSVGKVSVTKDGSLSYNSTLCKVMANYLCECRENNDLINASIDGLYRYVNKTINMLKGQDKKQVMELYKIDSERGYMDVLMVLNLISKNLDGSIKLEDVLIDSDIKKVSDTTITSADDKNKIKYVISGLLRNNTVDAMHNIMTKYIQTGNLSYFTNSNKIRKVMSSFTPEKLDRIMDEMINSALCEAVNMTRINYSDSQVESAIKLAFLDYDLSGFTNAESSRSYLGLVANYGKLMHAFRRKLNSDEEIIFNYLFNLEDEERRVLKLLLLNEDISSIDSDTLIKAKDNMMLLNNIAMSIANNIYKEIELNNKDNSNNIKR